MPIRLALVLFGLILSGCGHTDVGGHSASADAIPTASDQGDTSDDVALTQRIRQSILADERLSVMAHNVTIVTIHGHVTLRGHVGAAREKSEIGVRAREIAGIDAVDNEIDLSSDNSHR